MVLLNGTEFRPLAPERGSLVGKVAAGVNASESVIELSLAVESQATRAGMEGRNPMSLAAAAVYSASKMRGASVTQADVARAAGVSVLSVRESGKLIRTLVGIRKAGLADFRRVVSYLASLLSVVLLLSAMMPLLS